MHYKAAENHCVPLDAEGLIIGVMKDFPYEQQYEQLSPGDILLLYTDGVVEAQNEQDELFGEQRLASLLIEHHKLAPEELIDHILEQVRLFSGHHNFHDDVSLVVMQVEREEKKL